MKFIRWTSLARFFIGLALLLVGITAAGRVVLVVAAVIQLICAALTGKKTNDGMH